MQNLEHLTFTSPACGSDVQSQPYCFYRGQLFDNLKHLLVQRRMELLDDRALLQHLRALEEQKQSSGNIDIRPSHRQKDDVAVAVTLAALELSKRPQMREPFVGVFSVGPAYESSIAGPRPERLV